MEVYRQPQAINGKPLGYGYEEQAAYSETQQVSPLANLHTDITIADLLPLRRS